MTIMLAIVEVATNIIITEEVVAIQAVEVVRVITEAEVVDNETIDLTFA